MPDRPHVMLLLPETGRFKEAHAIDKLRELDPVRFDGIADAPDQGVPNLLSWKGRTFALIALDAPIPGTEAVVAAHGAFWWKDAPQVVAAHKAHLIVSPVDTQHEWDKARDDHNATADLAAGLATILGASAVYWGGTPRIWPPEKFAESAAGAAAKGKDGPAILWVDFRLFEKPVQVPLERNWLDKLLNRSARLIDGPQGKGLVTRGLKAIFDREIEFAPSLADGQVLVERAAGLIQYLLAAGPILKHGDMAGISANEKLRIEEDPTGVDGKPTWRLHLEKLEG